MENKNLLTVKNLRKEYKEFTLTDVSFSVPAGYIMRNYRSQLDALFTKIIVFMKNLNWGVAVIVSLVLYFSLMALAVKFQREKV